MYPCHHRHVWGFGYRVHPCQCSITAQITLRVGVRKREFPPFLSSSQSCFLFIFCFVRDSTLPSLEELLHFSLGEFLLPSDHIGQMTHPKNFDITLGSNGSRMLGEGVCDVLSAHTHIGKCRGGPGGGGGELPRD